MLIVLSKTSKKSLHERLIAIQSIEELERKRWKARRRGFWTQEDIDLAERKADQYLQLIGRNNCDYR